jgi:tRNA nucleotidyltransferase/poly(A) polymerase
MIRAVRFATRFGFRIDRRTAAAVRRHAPKIASISGERVFDELSRMLSRSSAAEAMRELEKLSLARELLPELFEREGLWDAALVRIAAVCRKQTANLAFGALLAELPSASVRRIIRRWGASNELRDELCFYARHLGDWQSAADSPLCDFKRLMGSGYFESLRVLWGIEERRLTGKRTQLRRIARRAGSIPKARIAPEPFVKGNDLIRMHLTEGPKLGRILKQLYDAQLNEQLTSRRGAMAIARRLVRDAQSQQ